jgi:hypothetical protein
VKKGMEIKTPPVLTKRTAVMAKRKRTAVAAKRADPPPPKSPCAAPNNASWTPDHLLAAKLRAAVTPVHADTQWC